MVTISAVPVCSLLLLGYLTPAEGIYCYQCNSTDLVHPYQCREHMPEDRDIEPMSCDEVFEAKYCIKHTGRFEAFGILCYQCFAPNNTDCSDLLIGQRDGSTVQAKSCDYVFEARYCIKANGVHAGKASQWGGVGTRRYCSSVDMGNYCNYIRQPGDQREYRSCVYTCSSDGCNGAASLLSSVFLIGAALTSLCWR